MLILVILVYFRHSFIRPFIFILVATILDVTRRWPDATCVLSKIDAGPILGRRQTPFSLSPFFFFLLPFLVSTSPSPPSPLLLLLLLLRESTTAGIGSRSRDYRASAWLAKRMPRGGDAILLKSLKCEFCKLRLIHGLHGVTRAPRLAFYRVLYFYVTGLRANK